MLKISECSENCNTCFVFKISAHVENCNACSKLCWILQGMLKTIICVENYVETACWKFQHVLKTVMHVESYVKISRCVENVYVRHVENHIKNRVEVRKKHHHTLRHVLKLRGNFVFLLWFCMRKRSETYIWTIFKLNHLKLNPSFAAKWWSRNIHSNLKMGLCPQHNKPNWRKWRRRKTKPPMSKSRWWRIGLTKGTS